MTKKGNSDILFAMVGCWLWGCGVFVVVEKVKRKKGKKENIKIESKIQRSVNDVRKNQISRARVLSLCSV